MLAAQHTVDTPLPFPGSFGYLRGTGQRARVLQRNHRPSPGGEPTCLVKLYELVRVPRAQVAEGGSTRMVWLPVEDANGNKTVEQRDLYADRETAIHGGRKPRRERRTRRSAR